MLRASSLRISVSVVSFKGYLMAIKWENLHLFLRLVLSASHYGWTGDWWYKLSWFCSNVFNSIKTKKVLHRKEDLN